MLKKKTTLNSSQYLKMKLKSCSGALHKYLMACVSVHVKTFPSNSLENLICAAGARA